MVNQVLKSGLSIFLMGCGGYALGHIANMNPKITAIVWVVAEISKQAFDCIGIYANSSEDAFSFSRGFLTFAIPLTLLKAKQISTFAQGLLTFFSVGVSMMLVEKLSPSYYLIPTN